MLAMSHHWKCRLVPVLRKYFSVTCISGAVRPLLGTEKCLDTISSALDAVELLIYYMFVATALWLMVEIMTLRTQSTEEVDMGLRGSPRIA
jgi:hypothetical protein